GKTLARALLEPTRLYVKPLLAALKASDGLAALAHITGGGFPENIPRVLPKGLGVSLDLAAIPVLPVFQWLAREGAVAESEMLRTFNSGVGMVAIAEKAKASEVERALSEAGLSPVRIGAVVAAQGDARVTTHGKLAL
ncbi:MAG: phosphoribosylformylglycinamidine cyclo-ligase, partial [Hyphomicrobiales bacterium]|nr:phosphoribosylformylglycinamidine cyclo-ligase [Hyphomicrobiales bacterium]